MSAQVLSAGDPRLLLNGEWCFAAGPDGAPPTTGWTRVRVPHRSREFEDAPPTSGWYRTTLRVPDAWQTIDRRLVLDLGRVRHFGRAYLGGGSLGEHHGMRLPWRLDLTPRVVAGGEYRLDVFTHNCSGGYVHPDVDELGDAATAALDTRFWYTSAATIGMESDVWLGLEALARIEDVHIITSVRAGSIRVAMTVRNDSAAAFTGRVQLRVARDGATQLSLDEVEVEVAAGDSQRLETSASWFDAILWGRPPYGEPVLYFLETALLDADRAVHAEVTRFGFREIWTEGERLFLNGIQLLPWGDHTMPYVYERQWLTRKFLDLAAANISIVEHHRYDPPAVFHEVADELGVFVVGADFCVGTGQVIQEEMDPAERELVMAHHLAVADHWIRSARNHPSILFWDITDARDPAYCVPLLRKVKELDDTRIAEVTFDPTVASDEMIELIDCYRLFSSLENIETSIATIRAGLPVKPIRVGEAGIFETGVWDAAQVPPLKEGWWDFLTSMPARNIHGLQTFFLADMDYHGFTGAVPGTLATPLDMEVRWPSQSGTDARVDPFGEGTQAARGKQHLSLNWCDPRQPVSRPTRTARWSRELFRRLAGRDVGPLSAKRVPEVLVQVVRDGEPVAHAQVFMAALDGQAFVAAGVQADAAGTAWFVLPEAGAYRFTCGSSSVDLVAGRQPIEAPPGYGHVQRVTLDLP